MILFRYKILTLIVSFISGLCIWPRVLNRIGLWLYYSSFVFVFFWLFAFFVVLYGIRNSTLRYKILNIAVMTCFLIELIGFGSSIGEANTPLCYVLPPSTYNGFRTAIVFSFIGSILIIINLLFVVFHQVKEKIQNNRTSQRNSKDSEVKEDFHRESYSFLSFISICFLSFHVSFFFEDIFGTVGCNGIPEQYIIPIGIFWLIPGILNVVYQIILKLPQMKNLKKSNFNIKFRKSL